MKLRDTDVARAIFEDAPVPTALVDAVEVHPCQPGVVRALGPERIGAARGTVPGLDPPRRRVLFLSAYAGPETAVVARREGARWFVPKPIRVGPLLNALAAVLSGLTVTAATSEGG
jgi:DNA-binding NarL/FixJ family response regulator